MSLILGNGLTLKKIVTNRASRVISPSEMTILDLVYRFFRSLHLKRFAIGLAITHLFRCNGQKNRIAQKPVSSLPMGIWGLSILLLLAGCHHSVPRLYVTKELPTRVAGTQDKAAMIILRRLSKHGVRVITIGQDYLISIPANRLFAGQSPRIKWLSYSVLNDVVCYLKQFRKVSVDVTAFSSKYVSPTRERALTAARARVVADYLWSQDIDSRFVFTRGLGSDKPIITGDQGGDNSPNSRVEITFRNAVA